jgi:glycine cleavage system H protein
MNQDKLLFSRSHFVTHLPVGYRYSRSHYWAKLRTDRRWRVGFTAFATRLLGETVDHAFETPVRAPVRLGQVLGWIEGFKGISDVLCMGEGIFVGGNPALDENSTLLNQATYTEGWLYEIDGELDKQSLDVQGYAEHLKATIDTLLEQRKTAQGSSADCA